MFTTNTLRGSPVYYPIGNTSATFLLEFLPPEQDASVLLLGCGDPRNILFTAYNVQDDGARNVDFTCCDIQPAILARNILLLSLILDDNPGENSLKYWRIFYHFRIDNDSLSIIHDQAQKLVRLSKSIDTWHESTYGSILRMVNQDTLSQLHSFWERYSETAGPNKHRDASVEKFRKGWHKILKSSRPRTANGVRAMGPFSTTMSIEAVEQQLQSFWDTGVAGGNTSDGDKATEYNPMFIYTSAGDEFAVNTDQDPLLGFHLEMAHAPEILKDGPFGKAFGSKSRVKTRRGMRDHLVEVAKAEFKEWCIAFNGMAARNKIAIRFHLGDVLRFCRALEVCSEKGSDAASFDYAQPWRAAPLKLDGGDYDTSSPSPAPMAFDVIETSNLTDHIGLLNLLIGAIPLLHPKPSSTLHTETFKGAQKAHHVQLTELLCGDVVTMSLLLGIAPMGYVTESIPNSFTQENIHKSIDGANIRISWKKPVMGNEPKCVFDSKELATALFRVYNMMFRLEYSSNALNILPQRKRNYYHFWYTRKTYAELLRLVKRRVDTDWSNFMEILLKNIAGDQTQDIGIGRVGFTDLLLHLYQSGVYDRVKTPLMTLTWPLPRFALESGILPEPDMPEVVTVALRVPRSRMKGFYLDKMDRTLCAGLEYSHNVFFMTSSVQTVYGRLIYSKDGLTTTIEEDTNAGDLIISFSVYRNHLFYMHPEPISVIFCILPDLTIPLEERKHLRGFERWIIYESALTNKDEVNIFRKPPGISCLRPIIKAQPPSPSTLSEDPSTEAPSVMVDFNKNTQVEKFKILLDYHHGNSESRELSEYSEPVLVQNSPCTVDIVIPGSGHQNLRFPYPVDASRAEFSVSRNESLFTRILFSTPPVIEISIPPSRPTDKTGFNSRMLQTVNTTPPISWDMPRVNFDRLPILATESSQDMDWLRIHLSCMYSDRERQNSPDNEETRIRSNLKDSLTSIFLKASDALPGQTSKVFAISSPSCSETQLLIFISNIRLDFGSRTVVADSRVLPLTKSISSSEKQALETLSEKGVSKLSVEDTELMRWREILPALVERCRNWKHTPSCEYIKLGIPVSTSTGTSPLCSCGVGKAPQTISEIREWRPFEKYWTRAAIAPIFAFPYGESCDMAIEGLKKFRSATEASKNKRILNSGRKAPEAARVSPQITKKDIKSPISPVDVGRKSMGVVTKTESPVPIDVCQSCKQKSGSRAMVVCKGCKKVSYCSVYCKKKDWERHKLVCKK